MIRIKGLNAGSDTGCIRRLSLHLVNSGIETVWDLLAVQYMFRCFRNNDDFERMVSRSGLGAHFKINVDDFVHREYMIRATLMLTAAGEVNGRGIAIST